MKHFIIYLCCLLFSSCCVYGQVMVNGDFSDNCGGNFAPDCIRPGLLPLGAGTFTNDCIPNWTPSHGSPQLIASDHTIYMGDEHGVGEGIVGGYPFKSGVTYMMHVGVHDVIRPAFIRIIIGKNPRPYVPVCSTTLITCGPDMGLDRYNGLCAMPASIASDPTKQEIPVGGLHVGDNAIMFTANDDFDWVMIFPYIMISDCDQNYTEVTLQYIWINQQCKEVLYAPIDLPSGMPSTPLPEMLFGYYEAIFVGSIHGGIPGTIVTTTPWGFTHFEAKAKIYIDDAFEVVPGSGYVLFDINPVACEDIPPDFHNACSIWGPPTLGTGEICRGSLLTLTAGTPGGTWTSTHPLAALVSGTGIVMPIGLMGDTTTIIKYTVGDCVATIHLTVIDCPGGSGASKEEPAPDNVVSETGISVYPVPSKDLITVTFPCKSSGQLDIVIKDVSGRVKYTESLTCTEGGAVSHNIDIADYTPGIYLIDLTINNEHTVKKIIKL